MAIPKRFLNALEKNKVKYRVLSHKTVFTAYDLATTLGEDLKKVAKTLLVRADKRYVLVVLPASARLDFKKLAKLLKAKTVSISPEAAIKKLKVMPGTTPPFGSLLGVPVVLEQMLLKAGDIIVRAGSLTESLCMKVKDFVKMESPILGVFRETAKKGVARKPTAAGAKKKK
ncbi:hypothetical protein HY634_01100 [Candidatus Uhrbacteria bacterium]|nr:hypothetical protein [Candidatus Uhrbacteria bacterium]